MAINYRKQKKSRGLEQTIVETSKYVSFREVCDTIIRHNSLFDRALIQHVTAKVVEVVTELVSQNMSVAIDGLGRFRPTLKKKGDGYKVGVSFIPERSTFLRLMNRQKLKEMNPEFEIYPECTPITTDEQKRRRRKLQREEKNL